VSPDAWDPLMSESRPEWYWTTTNIGEALPGVMTPLMWTLWGPSIEHAPRQSAFLTGALTRAEGMLPPSTTDWYCQVFYGRAAIRLDFLSTVGDRMPGTSGRDQVRNMFGEVPSDMHFEPTKRRYPIVAWRLPSLFVRFPRQLAALSQELDEWWRRSVTEVDALDREPTKALFRDAVRRHDEAMVAQTNGLLSTIQPLYDAVAALVRTAGVGDLSILTGASGGAEMAVVTDIWRASREEITLAEVVANHGFHGPNEGELSSRVWREDDTPLRKLIGQYRERESAHDPRRREHERAARYEREVQRVCAALPGWQRPLARILLRLARERLPLRGVGKRSFLQANDVARSAARRLGTLLADENVFADPDDIFYLTVEEVTAAHLPPEVQELIRRRRERRAGYQSLNLPEKWKGNPTPIPLTVQSQEPGPVLAAGDAVRGLGVSGGVVEGTVRVVTDPSFADVQPDEILVAPITDPSWSSIMFISAALVVDIGGALSHAAVVARELDIPCVVGSQNGTQLLRDGDWVRVDGDAGTVELIHRAENQAKENSHA
jgi:phosphohistidine swiveling domain-containing protein